MSRKRITQPISITLTPEQRAWVLDRVPPGGTVTETVRAIIQATMDKSCRHEAWGHDERGNEHCLACGASK